MIKFQEVGNWVPPSYEVKEHDQVIGTIGDGLRGEGYVFSPSVDTEMEEYLTYDVMWGILKKMEVLNDE